MVWWT